MSVYEEENKRLEETLKMMKQEIEKIKKDMENLRKMGTTLSYEDRKRGAHLNINASFDFNADNLKKIQNALPSPYFGRFDFSKNSSSGGAKFYIGKAGISINNYNLVNDWRSPICSLYYDSEIGPAEYTAVSGTISGFLTLKRQIDIKNGELISAFDTSLVSNDELLEPYLNTHADNKMKIIIASIQKEQNKIIRLNHNNNIIVQGVAGSGKTSVALHRIAYLIYTLANKATANEFLVLGPNDYFLNYVSSILPDLDTTPVIQKTLLEFTNDYIGKKSNLKLKADQLNKNVSKGNEAKTEMYKNVQAYKTSLEYKKHIDSFIQDYFENKLVVDDFIIDGEVIYTKEEVKDALFSGATYFPNFSKANIYLINNFKSNMSTIYDKVNKKYRDLYTKMPKTDPERKKIVDKSTEIYNSIKKDGIKYLKSYLKKMEKTPMALYVEFLKELDNYQIPELSNQEKQILKEETINDLRKKSISFVDIPALLHIQYLYSKEKSTYKYIVIDEAQDYGLFHFDALREIANKSYFSIYGDLAQSIYSYRSIDNWDEVRKKVFDDEADILELSKSYRTTIEVTENANKVLNHINLNSATPVIRHGNEVVFENKATDIHYKIGKISEWIEKGYKSVAIICKTEDEAKKINKDLNNYGIPSKYLSASDEEYSGGVFALTAASSKGLEFDTVMVNDASANLYSEQSDVDMHLLYVASTRALHEEVILYNKNITKPYEDCITKDNTEINRNKKLVKK